MKRLSAAKRAELKALLVKAYWASKTRREFAAVRIIWLMAGFGDPVLNGQFTRTPWL